MKIPAPFERYRSELETEMRSAVGADSSPFYGMMRYHLGWEDEHYQPRQAPSGKLLRPTLCLLACEAVGGDWRKALPAAAAIELVHNFTLIHDDIEDRSRERRHRLTVWKIWGLAQGLNTGDGMWALSQLTLLRLQGRGVSAETVMAVSRLLSDTCLRLCEGQHLDLDYERRQAIEVEDYLKMIHGKTARLFRCSLAVGALLGGAGDELVQGFDGLGRDLGLGFQVHDDLLGIWEDQKVTGKSRYTDIREKKKTLPVVYAHANVSGDHKERLARLYGQERIPARDIPEVLAILEGAGARRYTEQYRERLYRQALESVEGMAVPAWAQSELKQVAAFMLDQES